MRRVLFALVTICLLAGGATAAVQQLDYLDKLPPIIDREIFFGDPEIAAGRLSPDGKYISFLKTYKGHLNIWVKGIDEPFEAPVYGTDTALDMVVGALPLAPGYRTTLRTFDIISQSTKIMVLEVMGIEEVTVPAGTFETFKVELRNMDGEPGGGPVYISTNPKHHKVRSIMTLPPMMGGGTITSELQAVN